MAHYEMVSRTPKKGFSEESEERILLLLLLLRPCRTMDSSTVDQFFYFFFSLSLSFHSICPFSVSFTPFLCIRFLVSSSIASQLVFSILFLYSSLTLTSCKLVNVPSFLRFSFPSTLNSNSKVVFKYLFNIKIIIYKWTENKTKNTYDNDCNLLSGVYNDIDMFSSYARCSN